MSIGFFKWQKKKKKEIIVLVRYTSCKSCSQVLSQYFPRRRLWYNFHEKYTFYSLVEYHLHPPIIWNFINLLYLLQPIHHFLYIHIHTYIEKNTCFETNSLISSSVMMVLLLPPFGEDLTTKATGTSPAATSFILKQN